MAPLLVTKVNWRIQGHRLNELRIKYCELKCDGILSLGDPRLHLIHG